MLDAGQRSVFSVQPVLPPGKQKADQQMLLKCVRDQSKQLFFLVE